MNNTYEIALAEVYEILLCLPKDMQSKIPQKLLKIIEEEKDKNYKVNLKHPLSTQDYSKEAVILLGMIYIDYLCSTEEKSIIMKKTLELKKIYDKEIKEKYNVDNLFKENKDNKQINSNMYILKNETALIEYKKTFFTKIKKLIFKILHINR